MIFFKKNHIFSEISEIPPVLNQKVYPSLYGLRGVSILMVVIHHFILLYPKISGKFPYLRNLVFIGPLGVNVFFVISGFLITTLCIKEKVTTGCLSLKNFYIRRALRILPAAFSYIIVIAVINYFFKLSISWTSFIAATFFLANLSYFRTFSFDWDLGHYWSLSVEEQFYILVPFFIKKNFKIFVSMLFIVAFAAPALYIIQVTINHLNGSILSALVRYLMKFQAIAIGCLFAVCLFKNYVNLGKLSFAVTILSIIMIFSIKYDPLLNFQSCFMNMVISIFTGFIIVNNIHPQNNLVFKFLNLRPLKFIGLLSYSIYIWQQLFLSNDSRFAPSLFPVNLILLIAVPCLSYFYYEKFFLRLKAKFTKMRNLAS